MTSARPASNSIRAVVSDVDGTLLTNDKLLTDRARATVTELHARGIRFTIISSRPPRGMRMLLALLSIATPFAAFNGGIIAAPDMTNVAEHIITCEIARRALEFFQQRGIQTWLFTGQDWLVKDRDAPLVEHERRTVAFEPKVVSHFAPNLGSAAKIVSNDHSFLTMCENELSDEFAQRATVARSQLYYLDITHPLANKGVALLVLAKTMGVDPTEVAVIGDGGNDVAMFAISGVSIAMGNASDTVKAQASFITDANENEGFAKAVEQFVLPRVVARSPG